MLNLKSLSFDFQGVGGDESHFVNDLFVYCGLPLLPAMKRKLHVLLLDAASYILKAALVSSSLIAISAAFELFGAWPQLGS